MNTMNIDKAMKRGILGISVALLCAFGMIGGAAAFAQGTDATQAIQEQKATGIVFPIVELGNCADKAACKAYCDDGAHMDECVAFAESHGLMNKEEADRGTKFAATIKAGKGPGGCTSPSSCKSYCEDLTHMDECVSFAEKNNFKGEEYKQGKQMSAYLKKGGTMPGNCSSKQECEAYCGDFSHAEECFAFAQKTGGKSSGATSTPEQLKNLSTLAKNGETPGGCTSRDTCEAYCHTEGHFEECAVFGEKVGFISKSEGEQVRKIHTEGGPGGCKSPEACHAYCNDQTHHDECFAFAEQNGLIPKEDLAQMKEGLIRVREGVANAPEEVQACLKTVLGENVLDDLQSGKLTPGPDLGEKMRTCFDKFGGNHDPKDILKKAPPEVQACLKEKLGDDFTKITSGKTEPTTQVADAFRVCFQQSQFTQQGFGGPERTGSSTMMNRGPGQGGPMQGEGMMPKPNPDMFKNFLHSAPPQVAACVKEKLGDDAAKLESGDLVTTPELGQKLRPCFEQFRPTDTTPTNGKPPLPPTDANVQGDPTMMQGGMNGAPTGNSNVQFKLPPQVLDCLKGQMSEDDLKSLGTTRPTPEMEKLVRACFDQVGGRTGTPPQEATGQGGMVNTPTQPVGTNNTPGTAPSSGAPIPTEAINQMPPQIAACIKEKISATGGTETNREQVGMMVSACLKQFGSTGGTTNPVQPSMQGQGMPPQGNMNPAGTGTNMPSKPPMGGDGKMMLPPNGGDMMQKPPMDGPRPPMQPGMFNPGMPAGTNGTQPSNTMPPPSGTEPKPQAANFSQNLVAGAAMPFVLLWSFFR